MVEQQTLKTIITAIVFGGLAPYLSYRVMEWLKSHFPDWTYLHKWGAAWIVTLAIAWGAYGIGLYFSYFPMPAQTPQAWGEVLFTIGFGALTVNQGIHATKVYLETGKV